MTNSCKKQICWDVPDIWPGIGYPVAIRYPVVNIRNFLLFFSIAALQLGVCQKDFFEPDPDITEENLVLPDPVPGCLATPTIVSSANHEYRPGRLMIKALALVHTS